MSDVDRAQPNYLIDENLSPRTAQELASQGLDAVHARYYGLGGAQDHVVLDKAFEEDRIVVTLDVGDFERLASARELHPGIVLLEDGGLKKDDQVRLVRLAAATIEQELADGGEMVNRVLRVWEDETMEFEDLSLVGA